MVLGALVFPELVERLRKLHAHERQARVATERFAEVANRSLAVAFGAQDHALDEQDAIGRKGSGERLGAQEFRGEVVLA